MRQLLKSYEDQNLKLVEMEKKLKNQNMKYEKHLKEIEEKFNEIIKSYQEKLNYYEDNKGRDTVRFIENEDEKPFNATFSGKAHRDSERKDSNQISGFKKLDHYQKLKKQNDLNTTISKVYYD